MPSHGLLRRVLFFTALTIVSLAFAVPTPAAHAQDSNVERILHMDVTVKIGKDGVLWVNERIVFNVAGRNIKRGLVRVLPMRWKRPDGSSVGLGYSEIAIQRDGQAESWKQEQAGSDLEIFMGNANRLLSLGVHEYSITYRLDGAILRKDGFDSLYLNVTGNDWAFEIEQASFRLLLPDWTEASRATGQDERIVEKHIYTGFSGEQGEAAEFTSSGSVVSTSPIRPGQGLTVFYSWPTDITPNVEVKEFMGGLKNALLITFDNFYVLLPSILLIAFYLFFFRRWRNNGAEPVIPIFDPPANFLPGEARYAMKGHYDSDAFAADLLSLMNKKYLFQAVIEEGSQQIKVLSRYPNPAKLNGQSKADAALSSSDDALPPGGESFYKVLFPKNAIAVELESSNPKPGSREFGGVRVASCLSFAPTLLHLARECKKKWKNLFYPAKAVVFLGFFVWVFATILSWGLLKNSDASAGLLGVLMLFFIPLFLVLLPLVGLIKGMVANVTSSSGFKIKSFITSLIFGVAYFCFFTFFILKTNLAMTAWIMFSDLFGIGSVWGSVAPGGGLLAVLIGLGSFVLGFLFMPRRSVQGEQMLALSKGIEMYLETAEEHRFTALYSPTESVQHFESLLPYALALGVGHTWANSFADYCRKAGMAKLADQENKFMRTQTSLSKSISRSLRSGSSSGRSSSSSSRGGGSSGGGAGGGGGRGW